MKSLEILFIELLVSSLLVEFSLWGLLETQNNAYILAVVMSTAAIIYVCYRLYLLEPTHKPAVQKEHSFYYIMDNQPNQYLFDQQMKNRM